MSSASTTPMTMAQLRRVGSPKSVKVRDIRERIILGLLIFCGVFSVATTLSIVLILTINTVTFFAKPLVDAQGNVPDITVFDFIFGLQWNPLLGEEKHFGIWPLIGGTMMITVIAMLFALPVGLITAIWLSEYAAPKVRSVIKPVLEVLAGIPTVVFGFFALTVITPFLRFEFLQVAATDMQGNPMMAPDGTPIMEPWNPMNFGTYNALAAGLTVGIMCIPIVTSLSEDALRAVPRALREGAYGLGASKFETSVRVVVPAALSGIIAAFLLAIARAVGETMIVALAAGALPLPLYDDPLAVVDPRSQVQPMTGYMVQIFLGDVGHGGVEYYSVYAVAFTLFVITLSLTLGGGWIRKRFRQEYE